ncbi:MAG: Alkaline phosphatase synthesis sensor protein PhoR [Acidobacteria bacterium ADurb.Bin340]|nr:MAG: Alkaline phosphatase synthesis sensor protein PhoR [Acidobacteria bacterium ADurb.Bin340]
MDGMRLLLTLLVLGFAGLVSGGDPWTSLRPPLQIQGLAQGLPNSTVYALRLDRSGRLWVGTQDGVARYDGRSWIRVPLPDSATTNFVRALAESPDGSLWFGTETDGLWRLKDGLWTHHSRKDDLPSDRVNSLHVHREGAGWILAVGTGGGGVATFRDGRWHREDPTTPEGQAWVWKFSHLPSTPTRGGRLVAATKKGFLVLQEGRWRPFTELPGLENEDVNDVVAVPEPGGTRLWVSAWNLGLLAWDGRRWEKHAPENGFPSRFPVTLATTLGPGGKPVLWAATYDRGLIWREDGAWRALDETRGLPSNGVYALLNGGGGEPGLWVGLRGGGLVALGAGGWWSLDRQNGLPTAEVLSLADALGGPWIGTTRGAMRWDGSAWVREGVEHGLPSIHIQALAPAVDRPGLWAGTLGGLAFRGPVGWRKVEVGVPLGPDRIVSLLETRGPDGPVLWIGTEGGLLRKDARGTRRFTTRDGLPADNAFALRETRDAAGRTTLWVGTRGGGVARLVEGRWIHHGRETGLPNTTVYGFGEHRTADGRHWLWAGTFGGGAARLDLDRPDGSWEVFSTRNLPGLPSDVVVRVETDAQGRIYLATQRGVARLTFKDAQAPSRPTGLEAFGSGDGLVPLALTYGASVRDSQGRIWVATVEGAAAFDPAREREPEPLRGLSLAGVRIGQADHPLNEPLRLGHREGPLALSFTLPWLHRGEDLQFRSQLVGAEDEPGPWGAQASREFTALKPGRYTLRVWARDHRGREVGPLEVPFRVAPPWWAGPWAWLAGGLLVGGGLLLAHRVRVRLLRRRTSELRTRIREATVELERREVDLRRLDEEKNQFMGIAAHDLRTPLTAIGLAAEELALPGIAPETVSLSARQILQSVEQMTALIQNLLDINLIESGRLRLTPEDLDLRVLGAEQQMRHGFKARTKGQRIELDTAWDEVPAWADLVHLREVLDNLVSNALKFTPPGPPERVIWIRVRAQEGAGVMEIQDDGPGFTPEDHVRVFQRFAKLSARPTGGEASTGLGLSIARSLTEAMGGRLELESQPGRGATFRVILPARDPGTA